MMRIMRPIPVAILLGCIALITYAGVLTADFVMWDDDVSIYNNPRLAGLSFESVWWAFTDVDSTMRYIPLSLLSLSATYQFFGLNPLGYHGTNWLMHGINVALAFLVLRGLILFHLTGGRADGRASDRGGTDRKLTIIAGLCALLWGLHPLRVEVVAWANERSYCQATGFLFGSLLAYLHAKKPGLAPPLVRRATILSVFLFAGSVLSHPVGLFFPVVLLLLDIHPMGGGASGKRSWLPSRGAVLEKIPFLAIAIAQAGLTLGIRVASAGIWNDPVPLSEFGLLDRTMQALYIWAHYLWRPLFPVALSPVYTRLVDFNPLSFEFVLSGLLVVGLAAGFWMKRLKWRTGFTVFAAHLALLIPLLGITEHPHYPADRYGTFVTFVWVYFLAVGLLKTERAAPLVRKGIFVASLVVILALGLLSARQVSVWQNSETLFTHTLATLGDDPYRKDIHCRFGMLLAMKGRLDESKAHFRKTLAIQPSHFTANKYMGHVMVTQGHLEEAMFHYERALEKRPEDRGLGESLERLRKLTNQ